MKRAFARVATVSCLCWVACTGCAAEDGGANLADSGSSAHVDDAASDSPDPIERAPTDTLDGLGTTPDARAEVLDSQQEDPPGHEALFEHDPECNDGIRAAYEYCLVGGTPPLPLEGARTLDLGDIDADGQDDLLVAFPEEARVRVYWGASYIPFTDVVLDELFPAETVAYSARFLDIDADGALDIVASGYGSRFLALRGDGAGLFEPFDAALFQTHYYHRMWRDFALKDVNGDGLVDMVGFRDAYKGASWGYPLYILREVDGGFSYPRLVTSARSGVFVDLDLDGDLDVVMEDRKGNFLRIAWQQNDAGPYPVFEVMDEGMGGSSGTPVLWRPPTRKPARLLVGARDEILNVSVQHPEGVTAFEALGTTDSIGTRPWYPKLFDADGDGADDVLVAGTFQRRFAVMLTRNGQPLGSVFLGDAGPTRDAMAIGDVDGDGSPDGVFWSESEGALRVVSMAPEALEARSPGVLPVEQSTEQAMTGDLNGDGFADVVGVHSEKGLRVFLGDGAGGFKRKVVLDLPSMDPTGVAIGDLDGDGLDEIVAVGTSRMTVVQVNDFGAYKLKSQMLPYTAHAVAVAEKPDATGDGVADLFVTDMNQEVYLLKGDGAFGFEVVWSANHGGNGAGVRAGDFNGDGFAGCVTFGKYPKTLTRAFGNQGGVLSLAYTAISITARHVEVGDVNGDGLIDVVGGGGGGFATVGFARPDGSFRVVERDGDLKDEQTGVAVVDLDGDGTAEIVVPDHGDLIVLKANFDNEVDVGTPPQEVQRLSKPGYQRRLMPADIDGDGALDLWSLRSGTLLNAIFSRP